MAQDIPKDLVASVIYERKLLPKLIEAASSGLEVAPVASYLIDSIMNPSIRFIPLDDPQYIMGVAGLIAYGFITQEDADTVEALYVVPEVFTFSCIVNGLAVYVGDRGTQRSIPVGPNFNSEMI